MVSGKVSCLSLHVYTHTDTQTHSHASIQITAYIEYYRQLLPPYTHLNMPCTEFDMVHQLHMCTLLIYIEIPLPNSDAYMCCVTFRFMMSHLAMSLGDMFCMGRKGGNVGGGWVHPMGAKSMAMSGTCL